MQQNNEPLFEDKLQNYFIVEEKSSLQFPLHIHSYIEVVKVLAGELEMQIGNAIQKFSPGDMTIIFPNISHDYHTISDDNHTSMIIMNCDLSLIPVHNNILLDNVPTKFIIYPNEQHKDLGWIFTRLTHVNPLEDNNIFVGSLFSLMLCHAYPYMNLVPIDKSEDVYEFTQQIIAYVSRNCLEDITLESVAKEFGISKYKLSRIFSNDLKISFPNYLKKQRINNAEFLLTNTDKDITSIAYECGFHNQQSFNRSFKEVEGCTPSKFKKKLVNKSYPKNLIPLLPDGIVVEKDETASNPIFISG